MVRRYAGREIFANCRRVAGSGSRYHAPIRATGPAFVIIHRRRIASGDANGTDLKDVDGYRRQFLFDF
jgi:hypothetical protein